MRVDGNYGGKPGYEPNSYGIWQEQSQYRPPATPVNGDGNNYDFRADDDDYFTQPGNRFRKMNAGQRQRLFENTARSMANVPDFIKQRHIEHCRMADPEYGYGVAKALNMESEL